MRLLALLALSCSAASAASFSDAARGTTAAGFLELGAGARAAGMGEAFSAVADDATALYWNPAGLTSIAGQSASLMHGSYLGSSSLSYAGYGRKLGGGAIGASVQYFSAGSLTETNAAGADVGSFTPNDLAATIGYARKLGGFSVGAGGKLIRSRVLATAQTAALDMGMRTPAYLDGRLTLAAALVNLGGALKYESAKEKLPQAARVGSSFKLRERWLAALDVVAPKNDRPYAALGTEYRLAGDGPWQLAGRAGFNSQTLGSVDGFSGLTFGVGLGWRVCALDYAFLPMGGVGQAHRVSLTFTF